ncbi:hypothetical protein ACFFQW_12700 [Umezawaea endophytica]|uniref:HAF family extracellular repeat protein n=1 Tax=Umezawaea endophytica TaxID=1654476 RepID=A0A9X2ZZA9_9PSEU|nr:hypothetical protein [Umezawaea endophytica]MCS7477224.1 hypothetical protein [Umezawaea endophytica]
MLIRIAAVVAVAITAVASPTASAATCAPTLLPLPATRVAGVVLAADGQGGFAGEASSKRVLGSPTVHAVRWSGGQATDLGTLPGHSSQSVNVTGVNRAGTVVGDAPETSGLHRRAFRSTGTALAPLPEPAGVDSSWATGINDNGDVVGHVGKDFQQGTTIYTVHTAVLWPANAPSTVVALTGLPATGQTIATGVDQDGTVLVEHYPTTTDAFTATNLYLWKASAVRKLTIPSGTVAVDGTAIANGRVVGGTYASEFADGKGVLWEQDGSVVRPATAGTLHSVNRSGLSTGFTTTTTLTYGVWQGSALTATLTGSLGVNVAADNGSVAGWSRTGTSGDNQPTVWRCA